MSDKLAAVSTLTPAAEEKSKNPNDASGIRQRAAADLIRNIQAFRPILNQMRAILEEYSDVVAVHGPVTDSDLTALGVPASYVDGLSSYLTKQVDFLDAPSEDRHTYRSLINASKHVAAQI